MDYERFLDRIRQFLKEAQGELSNEDEKYLRNMADIKQMLANLEETGECDHTATLKTICQAVLYGNYIIVKNNSTVFSQKVSKLEEAESKGMPKILQPKIKEIYGYYAKLSELIKNMDNLVEKIKKMVNDLFERDCELTKKEKIAVKFLSIDFATAVKKTADYFNQADHVLKLFESDVVSYRMDQKNKHLICGGLLVLVTVVTAGTATAVIGSAAGATVAAGAAGAAGVGGSGVIALGNYIMYSKKCNKVNEKCEELNSDLRQLDVKKKDKNSTFEGELEKAEILENM